VSDLWPEAFVARMRAWLGDDSDDFFVALGKRDVGIRMNPLRGEPENLAARLPWNLSPVPWCSEGWWMATEGATARAKSVRAASGRGPLGGGHGTGTALGAHPYHTAGVVYMQDPSAMAAAVLLDPQPGEWVLDLAAAPGSKATHISARMQGQGVLVANDVARRRTSVLAMNLERMGATNVLVSNATPDRLAAAWSGLFDAMLVDAPCSGEGMFSRDARAVADWSLETVKGYARRQLHILEEAAPLLRPGGRLLYGTCTFSPEENEGVIGMFLAGHPDFEIAEPGDQVPEAGRGMMGRGHPEWIGAPEAVRRMVRLWPHRSPGHGHTYALLRRKGEPDGDLPARWTGRRVPGRVLGAYRQALQEVLVAMPPEEGLFLSKDDHLYVTPMDPDLWQGLPVLRPGWWVASSRHGKVNPDHALAMALEPEAVRTIVALTADDPRLRQYLDGSSWPDDGKPGFVMVTVDGFPLGWAKRAGGRLRSRYPVHLRRR